MDLWPPYVLIHVGTDICTCISTHKHVLNYTTHTQREMIFKIGSFLYCIQGCPVDILIIHRLILPLVFFSLKKQKFGIRCNSMIKLWSAYRVSRATSLALQHEQISQKYLGKKCTEIKKQPNKAVP